MPATLADTTLRLLDDLPPYEQNSKHIQGTLDVLAREIDRLDAAREQVRANFFPATADILLSLYESELGLSINPPDKTLDQRRTSVQAFMQKLHSTASGLSWQDDITRLIGTGWSYQEYDPADPTSPAPNVIRLHIPFAQEIASPPAPGATAGTGGTLAAGTYYYAITALNTWGETTASAATSVVVAASGSVALDWPDMAGATSYRVYRGATATTLGQIVEVTTSAYTDTGGAVGGAPPPATNTTESFQSFEAKLLARAVTPAHIDFEVAYEAGFILGASELGDVL